jgi:MATE family multidrug resistance protein
MQPIPLHDSADAPRRRPIAELMLLAMPTILQMLAYTIEQFTDTLMLSRVSDDHATAAGYAGGVVFSVISFGFGVLMLINALVSEAYGAKRFTDAGTSLWQGIWFALAYSLLVVPLMFCAGPVFRAMGHPDAFIALEVTYFNISVSMVVVKMLAIVMGQFMLAVNRPMVVFWAATAGMFLNIFVNWLLIFGNWGFPAMGVAGAAWGTNSAVLCELLIVCLIAFRPSMRKTYGLLPARFDRARFTELLRIGVPSGVQVTGDVVAWTLFFTKVMAYYGAAAMAANNYMIQYMKLSFMPAFGLSSAVTALVARYVGAGQPDVSEQRAHLGFKITAAYMLACGAVFWIWREPLMRVFTDDLEIIRIGGLLLLFCAVFQFFDAMFIVYNGALRGVKDTFIPTCVQVALCWTLVVVGGLSVAKLRPDWGVAGPWTAGCIYCVVLGLYLMARFRSGRWKARAAELATDPKVEMYAAEGERVASDAAAR